MGRFRALRCEPTYYHRTIREYIGHIRKVNGSQPPATKRVLGLSVEGIYVRTIWYRQTSGHIHVEVCQKFYDTDARLKDLCVSRAFNLQSSTGER